MFPAIVILIVLICAAILLFRFLDRLFLQDHWKNRDKRLNELVEEHPEWLK